MAHLKDNLNYLLLPVSESKKNHKNEFIGRVRFKNKLAESLNSALRNGGGSFLIGGYRGVGKTKLVEEVVKQRNFGLCKTQIIRLDLGVDSELSTRDILCDLTESLYARSKQRYSWWKFCTAFTAALLSLALLWHFIDIDNLFHTSHESFLRKNWYREAGLIKGIGTSLLVWVLLYPLLKSFYSRLLSSHWFIRDLTYATRFSREWEHSVAMPVPKLKVPLYQSSGKRRQEPISARRIQQQLIEYIKKLRNGRFYKTGNIIIFDEVDKINPGPSDNYTGNSKSRKQKVDELLGGLKALMNSAECAFIVVAGREIVDAYYSESGYTSVLYESVFDDIFYIPTLLTDWSDGQFDRYPSMVRKYVNDTVFGDVGDLTNWLKQKGPGPSLSSSEKVDYHFHFETFIKYLTLHSWGNFKRLKLMLNDHIEFLDYNMIARCEGQTNQQILEFLSKRVKQGRKPQKVLMFTPSDIRRMFVSARLFSLYEVNMGRYTSKTDDKAAVSGLIAILDTFRFHSRGFSRSMMDRTIAGIDVHAESSLSYIADDYVHATFQSMIRRTSNNIYPYRFYLTTDLELSYFAKLLGAKSSSFEFALDSAEPVREFYLREAKLQSPDGSAHSLLASAKIQAILGDLYVSEYRYDLASGSYSNAVYMLKNTLRTDGEGAWRDSGGVSLEAQYMLIRNLLKKGRLEEERENNIKATALYSEAKKTALILFERFNHYCTKTVRLNDSFSNVKLTHGEHHFLNEAVISSFAIDFANIKSGKFNELPDYFPRYSYSDLSNDNNKKARKFLSKYLTVAFFSCHYETLIDKQRQMIFPYLSKTSAVQYMWGQMQFSALASELKKILYGYRPDAIGSESALERFFELWFSLVKSLFRKGVCLSTRSTLEPNALLNPEQRLKESFESIFQAADRSKKEGRYAEAAHQYTSLLLNWNALLEIAPWKDFEKVKGKLDIDRGIDLSERPEWLNDVIRCAQSCVEKADKSANIILRDSVASMLSPEESKLYEKLRVLDVLNSLSEAEENTYSTIIWCRSNLSNYLLIFGIWEQYCRFSISQWIKQHTTEDNKDPKDIKFDMKNIPVPIGNLPRVQAMYHWLYARSEMHKLKSQIKSSKDTCAKVNASVLIIKQLSLALDTYKKAFRSDDPDSFPSKTHIYYNLGELINLLESTGSSSDKSLLSLVRGALRNEQVSKFQQFNSTSETEKQSIQNLDSPNQHVNFEADNQILLYLDREYVKLHLNKYRFDLLEIDNMDSLTYKRKLRHKYFLYDDFDDPFYIAEWSHLRMMSSTCRLLNFEDPKDPPQINRQLLLQFDVTSP